jgi:tRNA 2-thiouridine synthesizing protein E
MNEEERTMTYATTVEYKIGNNPQYPHAPEGWEQVDAEQLAQQEGIELGLEHLALIRSLQEYFSRHQQSGINVRELSDALDEAFHAKGGKRYLHSLFPGGPIAQGCRLAGLPVPHGAVDKSFGSVQ